MGEDDKEEPLSEAMHACREAWRRLARLHSKKAALIQMCGSVSLALRDGLLRANQQGGIEIIRHGGLMPGKEARWATVDETGELLADPGDTTKTLKNLEAQIRGYGFGDSIEKRWARP